LKVKCALPSICQPSLALDASLLSERDALTRLVADLEKVLEFDLIYPQSSLIPRSFLRAKTRNRLALPKLRSVVNSKYNFTFWVAHRAALVHPLMNSMLALAWTLPVVRATLFDA